MALHPDFIHVPIAHRGLHRPGLPENSMAAFRAAIAHGYGIECDIQRAMDGTPMVFHDYELGRLTGENAVALVVYDGLPQDSIVDADVAAVIQSTRQGVGKQIADMVRQLINGEAIEQLQVLWQPEFSPGKTA